jgi:hypothetical protein
LGRAPSLRVIPWYFALQLRKKQGKTSLKVSEECQLAYLQQLASGIFWSPRESFSVSFTRALNRFSGSISNFTERRPIGVAWKGVRTNKTNPIGAIRDYVNTPQNSRKFMVSTGASYKLSFRFYLYCQRFFSNEATKERKWSIACAESDFCQYFYLVTN